MAVRLYCGNPKALLDAIKSAVRDGSIETWELDGDGDFTHSREQWKEKAWFRPILEDGKIVFNILGQKGVVMSRTIYGVYHGRFIEILLTHFDTRFARATATALPIDGDRVGSS